MSEYHVASFIAYAYPENKQQVINQLNAMQTCDVHGEDEGGRIILTLEGDSQQEIVSGFDRIVNINGVLNLSPVYHEYCDESVASVS